MNDVVKVGTVGEEQFVVSEQHLIDFAHDGMPLRGDATGVK